MRRLALLVCLCVSFASAQEVARFTVGFGDLVVGAWNHIAVHGRDLAGHTLRIDIELGTLREQARYETHEFQFPAGRGNVVLEQFVYIPTDARTLAWRVMAGTRTVHSGQLSVPEDGHMPVVLLVGVPPSSVPLRLRTERVAAHDLLPDPAAYDGVAAIVLSGSGVAPSLESITAAAAMGATVFVPAELPPSFAALGRLAERTAGGLGAGALTVGNATPDELNHAVASWASRAERVQHLLEETPPLPPLPLSGHVWLLVVALYLALARTVSYVRGLPGIASVVLLAVVATAAVALSMVGTEATTHVDNIVSANGGLQRVDEVRIVHERGGAITRTYYPPRVEQQP